MAKLTRQDLDRMIAEIRPIQIGSESIEVPLNLHGADLSGLDLSGIDLRGANLHGAIFDGANVRGAKFDHANGHGSSWQGAVSDAQTSWVGFNGHDSVFDGLVVDGGTVGSFERANLHRASFRAVVDGARTRIALDLKGEGFKDSNRTSAVDSDGRSFVR